MPLLMLPRPGQQQAVYQVTGALTIVPRITAALASSPVAGPVAGPLPTGFLPNSIHTITINGLVDVNSATVNNAIVNGVVTRIDNGAVLWGPTLMPAGSAGQYLVDTATTAFPANVGVLVTVDIYDPTGVTLFLTKFMALYPYPFVPLNFARLSTNRFTLSAIADKGSLQTSANTACQMSITDGLGNSVIVTTAMSALSGNACYLDVPEIDWPPGGPYTVAVQVMDQTLTTLRGTLYGLVQPGALV